MARLAVLALLAVSALALTTPHYARAELAASHAAHAARLVTPVAETQPKQRIRRAKRCGPQAPLSSTTKAAAKPTTPVNVAPEPAPKPTTDKPAPKPTTVAPRPTADPKPTSNPPPPPATGGSCGARSTLGGLSGDGTFFDTGLGACGQTTSNSDFIVAVSMDLYDSFPGYSGGNPNNNPICGKKVKANYQGKSVTVTVVDRCVGCACGALDFSPAAFEKLADFGEGRIHGVTWSFV
ncbi:barwin-like endoglucanase [Auricularia subglabra TFB-10046 SS5]|nr:barwin-like endoglucanase [Auricularia subglabra TFB-10046 SS5]